MKKAVLGILLAGTILSLPVQSEAHERQCPKTIEVSYSEAVELMEIASAEAGNQGQQGMELIMSVVLNRVASPSFPNDIHSVIHQTGQFATSSMHKVDIPVEAHLALASIEMGNVTPGIIGFETINSKELDKYFDQDFIYLDHQFYKTKEQ